MKKILTTCIAFLSFIFLMAQSNRAFWVEAGADQGISHSGVIPEKHRILRFDFPGLVSYLRQAPEEFTEAARNQPLLLDLPLPDGNIASYAVRQVHILEPGLAARFPMIKTYAGYQVNEPMQTLRLTCGETGLHATLFGPEGTRFIVPAVENQTEIYAAFDGNDLENHPAVYCGNHDEVAENIPEDSQLRDGQIQTGLRTLGEPVNLKTYRLAVATTAEFSSNNGNTPGSVLTAVTNIMNQVNGIYERDHAIRLVLIENTTQTFFFPPGNMDPYTNGNAGTMINENPAVLSSTYSLSGFDIGHVFGVAPGGGVIGVAELGSVCSSSKARGASNVLDPTDFYKTVAHELGHQFNATHTFNFCDNDSQEVSTAYQPGGGSTIMDYAGACGANSVKSNQDDYFHINSLIRIENFSNNPGEGGACKVDIADGNNKPDVFIPNGAGLTIPINTPFRLTGEATDPEGQNMTYTWEQYDLGPMVPLGSPALNSPSFRSFPPSNSPVRVFPRMQNIINNSPDIREVLPAYSRGLTFRFTARDNDLPAGAWGTQEVQFSATASAGPFLVSNPNTPDVTWEVGQYREVAWDVANTEKAPVNCKFVNILLSKDGGNTYPVTLLANTPNDGSAFVVVPDEVTTNARVLVEAAGNIFFDISNANFPIVAASQPGFAVYHSPQFGQVCLPGGFEVNLQTTSLLDFSDSISFLVKNLPEGATAMFSANPVFPGEETTVTLDFANSTADGLVSIVIEATAAALPVTTRNVDLNIVYNDYSALVTTSPADGASGQTTLPVFAWTSLPNVSSYDIQIATDPGFSNIVDGATGLGVTNYIPSLTLEDDTPYFWRVRGVNECGILPYIDPASFHTVSQTCQTIQSTNQPVTISGQGLPVISAVIPVTQSGAISDINVRSITGTHVALGDLAFRLKSPDGTKVTLLSEPPCNSSSFNMGFDDQSPLSIVNCPGAGLIYKPLQSLAAFNGKDVLGDWTLEVAVVNPAGEGGTFQKWAIEYCAALQSQNPVLIKNDTLGVPPNGTRLVYQDRLIVEDADNLPDELEFTIVKNTAFGTVFLHGQPLGVGDHFTMLDVYASSVMYTNTDPDVLNDYFTFTVSDNGGGYFGTPRFNIKIDPNAEPSSVLNADKRDHVLLYPNPAGSQVTVDFRQPTQGRVEVCILNMQGQLQHKAVFDQAADKISLNTSNIAAGMYLLQLNTPQGLLVKKLVIR